MTAKTSKTPQTRAPQIKRLVMFKHGVAYLERGGPAAGSFSLSFKREEMNDVLKSLAVWIEKGEGKIGAVAFEAPEDPEKELEERGLSLRPGASIRDLLHAFRGRSVEVVRGERRHRGEILGFEGGAGTVTEGSFPTKITLRNEEGGIAVIDLDSVEELRFLDPQGSADLAWLTDRSRAATSRTRRAVKVGLDGEAEDLRVAYIVPAPIWRVSYRAVVEDEKSTLMAWAIVHNPVDEPLEEVSLTLTTGQPVSFVIDLYKPRHVKRAVVEETDRAGAAPTSFERSRRRAKPPGGPPAPGAPPPPPAAAPAPMMRSAAFGGGGMGSYGAAASESMQGAAEATDRSEFFEYRVSTPLTLSRGASAMVPLAAAPLSAKRERIWRQGGGKHPDIVLSFANDTDLVLEEGPAVIYDEGGYAGEAMVPYSARDAEVRLAFAKDLSIECRIETRYDSRATRVRLGDDALIETYEHEHRHTLIAESDHGEEQEVILELHRNHGREISEEAAQPFESTASYHRFKVLAPAHGKGEVEVIERWKQASRVLYKHMTAERLRGWLEKRFMDNATFEALAGVLGHWEEAARHRAKEQALIAERQELYQSQQQINEQLRVLRDGGEEGRLRLRYVGELEEAQNRIQAINREMLIHRESTEAAERHAREALAALTRAQTPAS